MNHRPDVDLVDDEIWPGGAFEEAVLVWPSVFDRVVALNERVVEGCNLLLGHGRLFNSRRVKVPNRE